MRSERILSPSLRLPEQVSPFSIDEECFLSPVSSRRAGGHGGWLQGLLPIGLTWVELLSVQYIRAHLGLSAEAKDD